MSARQIAAVVAAPVVAALGVAAGVLLSGAHRRHGATDAEVTAVLPGDDLLPTAAVQNDRAVTIAAPPEAVWPWIAQMGQDKAGFYSFEVLENLVGCQITGADRVHPEWQDVHVGDSFRLHPEIALRVAQVEPARALVVTSQGGDGPGEASFDFTWAFHLVPGPAGRTRLHVRERYQADGRAARLMVEVTSMISALMTWRMMARLKSLVPDPARSSRPAR